MRINRYVALATGCSRRAADKLVATGNVTVNGQPATLGQEISESDEIICESHQLALAVPHQLIMLNKPVGYVCSRAGQGNKTIYDLLPPEFHSLKPVGRLDKNSSGLLLLTNDGKLAHELTHPKFQKEKVYEAVLDKPLTPADKIKIEQSVQLEDGPSKLMLKGAGQTWQIKMSEGRNRQIRRTFAALGYHVTKLHRTHFGAYKLGDTGSGSYCTAINTIA